MEDLLVERYEDLFESDPEAMLAAAKNDDGEVVFEETGDAIIDKWERELAQGLTPDLTEGLSSEELVKLENEKRTSVRAKELTNSVPTGDILEQLMGQDRPSSKGDLVQRGDMLGNDGPVGLRSGSNLGKRR